MGVATQAAPVYFEFLGWRLKKICFTQKELENEEGEAYAVAQ